MTGRASNGRYRDGAIQMDTQPLDLDGVLGELSREDAARGCRPGPGSATST